MIGSRPRAEKWGHRSVSGSSASASPREIDGSQPRSLAGPQTGPRQDAVPRILGAIAEGRSPTVQVFVFEHVTGGGLAGRDLPVSWAIEGRAIRRAIVDDFASVPNVRVVTTLDARVPLEGPPGVEIQVVGDRDSGWFEPIAASADYTVIIAPETDGILDGWTRAVDRAGGRSIGSDSSSIALTADKVRLAAHFESMGIPTPPTLRWSPTHGLPTGWSGPIIVKPVDGAGSVDTFVVLDPGSLPSGVRSMTRAMAQPYLAGIPSSACVLVDRSGTPTLLALGRQRIEVDEESRVRYRGGTIVGPIELDLTVVEQAVRSVPGLRGFVGVDFLETTGGHLTVLEINPRPTTSWVGLARLFPPGTIAGAWLAAAEGPLAPTDWPDRLRIGRKTSPVTFDADGTIRNDLVDDLP